MSRVSEGKSNRSMKKTPHQLSVLEKAYASNPKPNNGTTTKLSNDLGLTFGQVQGWFKRQRVKTREALRAQQVYESASESGSGSESNLWQPSEPLANKNLSPTTDTGISGSNHVVQKKQSKSNRTCVRRSGRIQSLIKSIDQNEEIELTSLVESEKEEDETHDEEQTFTVSETHHDDSSNEPTSDQTILDQKVNELINAITGVKTKAPQKKVKFLFKSLYLDSQTKIEALTSKNRELARNLEITLGKLEVYEDFNKSAQMNMISTFEKAIAALVRPMFHSGQFSSSGGASEAGGGDVVAKTTLAKKSRHDETSM